MTGPCVDLNCDMGESFGAYTLGNDAEVIPYITSANIACGFHAGDPSVMNRTVKLAADHGVGVGAHPGFPDLLGFGRRNMDCTLEEIRDYVSYQVGAMSAFCARHRVELQHVKPHGALYNMAAADEHVGRAIAEAVADIDVNLFLVTLAGKNSERMAAVCREIGIRVAFEAFPDRAYTAEGTLASRRLPCAVITDPEQVAERALTMVKEGKVIAIDGSVCPMEVHTLCVHGDTPTAVELVRGIRGRLTSEGVTVRPLQEFSTTAP